jgi:homocysteine S-methyltransferase
MSVEQARDYHMAQLRSFAEAGADMATAFTINYVEEAIGIVLAATALGLPIVISFTVETDGRLPSGMHLGEAIERVDKATLAAPAYYMINCAHPTHFAHLLDPKAGWVRRIRGIRANSSKRSHAELDAAPDLDAGDPVELGQQYRALRDRHSQIVVLGGCCGTDCRHVEQIRLACLAA